MEYLLYIPFLHASPLQNVPILGHMNEDYLVYSDEIMYI